MGKMSIAQQRFLENAVLIAALQLIFKRLEKSDIPLYSLGEIANTTSGGTPDRGRSEYYEGDIPWIKSGELNDGVIESSEEYITNIGLSNSSAKIYPEGTLVVALYGATVGKTGILAIDAASNQAVCAVTPINEDVNKYFLFWFLRYKRPDFLKSSFGGAQPNISQKILRETILPLPSSNLQRQICAYLEAIESRLKERNSSVIVPDLPAPLSKINSTVQKIEELAAKIGEARGLHQSLLKEFEYLCDENIFKSFVGPSRFIYEIANVTKLAGFEYTEYFTNAEPGDVKVIRAGNVRNEGLDLTYTPTISKQISDMLPRSKLSPGDIVMTFIGANIGDVTFVPVDSVNLHCGPNVSKITPSKEISHLYLAYVLRSPGIKKQIQEITKNTAQPSLSMKTIRNLSIPVPSFNRQIELVNQMGKIEGVSAKASKMLDEITKELNALLPSILDKAFKGEL